MILYLDASALVKLYVVEPDSRETTALAERAQVLATSLISRAEVASAMAKAVRLRVLTPTAGRKAHKIFAAQWTDFLRVQLTEALVARAESVAWDFGLRGYDAVQLASALTFQEAVGEPVTLATFDRELWHAGEKAGLNHWPDEL